MHALQHPHLSRAIGVSIVAALLAIVITLLFATALSDLNQPGGAGSAARPAVPSAISVQPTVAAPAWVSGPVASPLRVALP
jgi:uncharacterized lipoprotein YbaY